MNPKLITLVLCAALAAAVTGCADGPAGPRVAAELRVSPASVTLTACEAMPLNGIAMDPSGSFLSPEQIEWSSEDPEIARVDDEGLVTGVSEGTTSISARAGALHESVSVTVQWRPSEIALASVDSVGPLVRKLDVTLDTEKGVEV